MSTQEGETGEMIPLVSEEEITSNDPAVIEKARRKLVSHYRREAARQGNDLLQQTGQQKAVIEIMEVVAGHTNQRLSVIAGLGDPDERKTQEAENIHAEQGKLALLKTQLLEGAADDTRQTLIDSYIACVRTYNALLFSPKELLPGILKDPSLGGIVICH